MKRMRMSIKLASGSEYVCSGQTREELQTDFESLFSRLNLRCVFLPEGKDLFTVEEGDLLCVADPIARIERDGFEKGGNGHTRF